MTPVGGPALPKLALVGAGAVGLALGARLAAAGVDVAVLARTEAAARRIARDGIAVRDPATDEEIEARVSTAATSPAEIEDLASRTALLCVRAPDTATVVAELARTAPAIAVACAQNDVDNEDVAAAVFDRVVGVVVRQTCTRTSPRSALALGRGRIVVGPASAAASGDARSLAAAFRAAGFDVGESPDVRADKWLKLCINLMSVPNALVRRGEHASEAFVEIKARLLEEARDALAAAGVAARSCDGRDRSLDEEIVFQRASAAAGTSARDLPLYNAVWAALRYGAPLEADLYHERIVALARAHGVAAPMNARALDLALRARREGRGPESARCADFLDGIHAA